MVHGTPNPCLWSDRLGEMLAFCFLPGDSHGCLHANSFEKSRKSHTYFILLYRHFPLFLCFKTWCFPALLPPQGTSVLGTHFGLFFRHIYKTKWKQWNKMQSIAKLCKSFTSQEDVYLCIGAGEDNTYKCSQPSDLEASVLVIHFWSTDNTKAERLWQHWSCSSFVG